MKIVSNQILYLIYIFFKLLKKFFNNKKLYASYFVLVHIYVIKSLTFLYMNRINIFVDQENNFDISKECNLLFLQEKVFLQIVIILINLQKIFDDKTGYSLKFVSFYFVFCVVISPNSSTIIILHSISNLMFCSGISIIIIFSRSNNFYFRYFFTAFILYSFSLMILYGINVLSSINCLQISLK